MSCRRWALSPAGAEAAGAARGAGATGGAGSARAWALLLGAHFVWRPLGDLYESVRTGTPGFSRLYGERFFEWCKTHPEDASVLNAAMSIGSAQRLPAILAAYDFSQFMCLVDVGGGHGALLVGILSASPKTRGVLYDLRWGGHRHEACSMTSPT